MKRILVRSLFALAVAAACLTGAPIPAAQEAAPQGLPKAEALFDREMEAMGGKAALQKVKTMVISGRMVSPDLEGQFARYQTVGKTYQEVNFKEVGKIEGGVNGGVAWEKNPITGARLLDGVEKEQAQREALLPADADWRVRYKGVKTAGEEMIAGQPAYKIHATTKEGEQEVIYLDKKSGLRVRQEITTATPEGKVTMVQHFSDFRKVDGVVYPFTIKMEIDAVEVEMILDRVEHNVDIPESQFALPADVKQLVQQQKGG